MFLADAPRMIREVEDGVAAGDAARTAAAAHALKGSAGLFSTGEAYTVARDVEQRARTEDPAALKESVSTLKKAVADLVRGLEKLKTKLTAPASRISPRRESRGRIAPSAARNRRMC